MSSFTVASFVSVAEEAMEAKKALAINILFSPLQRFHRRKLTKVHVNCYACHSRCWN